MFLTTSKPNFNLRDIMESKGGGSEINGLCESALTVLKGEILARKRRSHERKSSGAKKAFPAKIKQKEVIRAGEEDKLRFEESKKMLEIKSRLYDRLISGECEAPLDEDNPFMVDFERKARGVVERAYVNLKVRGNFIEYVDQLGRTRNCTRDEFERLEGLNAPKQIEIDRREADFMDDIEEDHRNRLRAKWAVEMDRLAQARNIHYEHLRSDEVRELGVGYFAFSQDDQERAAQLERFRELRNETVREREKAVLDQIRSKSRMDDRLNRIRRNRGLEVVVESEQDALNGCLSDLLNGVDRILSINLEGKGARVADEVVHRQKTKDCSSGGEIFGSKDEHFRNRLRNERNPEFAPPYQ